MGVRVISLGVYLALLEASHSPNLILVVKCLGRVHREGATDLGRGFNPSSTPSNFFVYFSRQPISTHTHTHIEILQIVGTVKSAQAGSYRGQSTPACGTPAVEPR